MKYKKSIRRNHRSRYNKITKLLRIDPDEYVPENYHKLRVEIKKIRALCEMIKSCKGKFNSKKAFNPLKIIFNKAGYIRDLQVEDSLLTKYNKLFGDENTGSILDKKIILKKKNYKKTLTMSLKKDTSKSLKYIQNKIDDLKHTSLDDYFTKKENKIKELINSDIRSELLHELRKQLKTFLYNLQAIGLTKDNNQLFQLDQQQEMIGNWHDVINTTKLLRGYVKEKDITSTKLTRITNGLHKRALLLEKQIGQNNKKLYKLIKIKDLIESSD